MLPQLFLILSLCALNIFNSLQAYIYIYIFILNECSLLIYIYILNLPAIDLSRCDVMRRCWSPFANQRPVFTEIKKSMQRFFEEYENEEFQTAENAAQRLVANC